MKFNTLQDTSIRPMKCMYFIYNLKIGRNSMRNYKRNKFPLKMGGKCFKDKYECSAPPFM